MADLTKNEEQPWRVQALREECKRLTTELRIATDSNRALEVARDDWRSLSVRLQDERDRWMHQAGSERENAVDLQEQLRVMREGYELAIGALREEIETLAAGRHGTQRDAAAANVSAHETAPGGTLERSGLRVDHGDVE